MLTSSAQLSKLSIRILLFVAVALATSAWSPAAHAYAWMIRHEYTGCVQCHADPSGGGLLTAYGRAQAEVLLRTPYGSPVEEPGKVSGFLFGTFETPEAILLGGDLRAFYYDVIPEGAPALSDEFLMQADLTGQVQVDRFRANGSVGYAQKGALPASITHGGTNNLVSRVHWLGIDLGEDKQLTARLGRMNLPFGIRSIEHTTWVRSSTRTDTNSAQEYGASLAWNVPKWRAEVMAIAGNFAVNPDKYRERGYSGYLEWAPASKLAIGASSLITHADKDIQLATGLFRQAHGVFGRYSPIKQLVLLAEMDLLVSSYRRIGTNTAITGVSHASMLQVDYEILQGLHAMATGELMNQPADSGASYAGWATAAWFFAPHADVRVDLLRQSIPAGPERIGITSFLMQLHVFL